MIFFYRPRQPLGLGKLENFDLNRRLCLVYRAFAIGIGTNREGSKKVHPPPLHCQPNSNVNEPICILSITVR